MGYAKSSKRPIKRVEELLKQMVNANGSEIRFKVQDAEETAYRLREAFASARFFATHGEPYISYANLKAKYVVRSNGNIVTCEPREYVPSMQVKKEMATVTIPGVKDTLGIIGAAITHKAPCMVFSDASESTVNEKVLENWTEQNAYSYDIADNHVTLTKKFSLHDE